MNIRWRLVTTIEEFLAATNSWSGPIAADTETAHNKHLLGVSLAPLQCGGGVEAIYIPLLHWNKEAQYFEYGCERNFLPSYLADWLKTKELIGFNFTYDKHWLEETLPCFPTKWKACARIMWHMADAPASKRPYGLKNAQTELLGWNSSNERELKENVQSYGGRLTNGEHYLADLPILAKYACLDAYSTIRSYALLSPFFDKHDYWPFLSARMAYNELLETNTRLGIKVDVKGLQKADKRLIKRREAAKKRFLKILAPEVKELEENWKDFKVSQYKFQSSKDLYLQSPHRWKKFNLNSDKDKRELFYGKLGLPVLEETDSGMPSTAADSLRFASKQYLREQGEKGQEEHPALKAYLTYEKANTLSTNFTGPYLNSLLDNRLHPGFNICGTVSYRLGGFKPYLLNAPYDEKEIMRNMLVDEGHIGVHADLSAIEPTIAAHYSDDPTLLKVFKQGLGDIYLDLSLELFPNDKELQDGYNPNVPITEEVKKRFSRQRKIAKIIHLAISYTGTGYTVSKTLTKDGIPISVAEADVLVAIYWKKFRAVKQFEKRLQEENKAQGYVRNAIGMIIRTPWPDYKDLYNRFLQSSGHGVLELWVMEIYKLCKERGIDIKPVVLDIHDSTSNSCPIAQVKELKKAYLDALHNVNAMLGLTVEVKAEMKEFRTLAGLKQEE